MSKSLIKDAVHSGSPLKHLVEKALTQLNIPPDEHARAFDMISQALLFFDDEPTGGPFDEYFAEAGSFEAALYEVGKGYGATDADMASFVAVMDTTGDVMIGDVDLADIPEDSDEGNWTAPEVTEEGFPDHRTKTPTGRSSNSQTPLSFGRGRQSLPGARVGQSLSLSQIPTAHRMPSSIPTGIGQGEEATAEEGHPPGETDKATPAEHQESSAGGLRLEPHLAKQEGDPEPSRHLLRNGCTC